MKKSTLISTLAMVVIVALALTTATFAWYTASTTVDATSTATAAVASSANLTIGPSEDDATLTSYPITGKTGILPAAPVNNWSATATAPTIAKAGEIKSTDTTAQLLNALVDSTNKFTADGSAVGTPFVGTFAVKNAKGAAKTSAITMSLSENLVGDATTSPVKNMLRVAVFVGTEYKGTLCISETAKATVYAMKEVVDEDVEVAEGEEPVKKTVAGMKAGDVASTLLTYDATTEVTLIDELEGDSAITVTFLAWFDGSMLTTTYSGEEVSFKFTIS